MHETAAEPGAIRVIHANECVRERWKNGGGWTRPVARGSLPPMGPAEGAGWDWRLSVAEIDEDAAFSTFPGVERELVLRSGNGLRIFREGRVDEVLPPYGRLRFAGEDKVRGERLDGRVEVVNFMWRRDRCELTVWHRPLVGSMLVFAEPGSTWVAHVLAGSLSTCPTSTGEGSARLHLEAGDSLVVDAGDGRRRCPLDGGGELLLARITGVADGGTGWSQAPGHGSTQ